MASARGTLGFKKPVLSTFPGKFRRFSDSSGRSWTLSDVPGRLSTFSGHFKIASCRSDSFQTILIVVAATFVAVLPEMDHFQIVFELLLCPFSEVLVHFLDDSFSVFEISIGQGWDFSMSLPSRPLEAPVLAN